MANCVQCGSRIPDGQNVCSMCYGDIGYGQDGYYEQWAREQNRQEEERQEEEQRQEVTDGGQCAIEPGSNGADSVPGGGAGESACAGTGEVTG